MPFDSATDFSGYMLSNGMLKAIDSVNYVNPTPVQHTTLPLVLAGLDLIVQSQTGTGKTAAFAIPIVEQLERNDGVLEVLVLAPTRELAKQVSEEFAKFGKHKNISVATIYGGSSYERQFEALETAQIVTATPGRLRDLIDRGKVNLSKLKYFCLDEADEMLSMGFQEEVDAIVRRLPEERQSLLFSATITNEVRALGKKMLFYPEFITHSAENVAAEDVSHVYFKIDGVGRVRDLVRVLEFEEPDNAIIFANTKDDTFMVTSYLKRYGFRADALNGDLPQSARERTLAALRDGKIDFLVATDVAARGIDISDLSYVINFMIPESPEVYVHRTGRTGRAGKKGKAMSLVSSGELATLFAIRKLYEVPIREESLPTSRQLVEQKQKNFVKRLVSHVSDSPRGGHVGVARYLLENPTEETVQLIAHLLSIAETPAKKRNGVATASVEPVQPVEEEKRTRTPEKKKTRSSDKDSSRGDSKRGKRDDSRDKSPDKKSEKKRDSKRDDKRGDKKSTQKPKKRGDQDRAPKKGKGKSNKSDDRKPRGKKDHRDSNKSSKKKGARGNKNGGRKKREPDFDEVESTEHRMSKIWVNAGKDNFGSASEVEEMVCVMAGVDTDDLGKVTFGDSFSYIEVRRDYFFDIIKAMNKQVYNGLTLSAEPARK